MLQSSLISPNPVSRKSRLIKSEKSDYSRNALSLSVELFLVGWVEPQVFIAALPKTNIGETQHPNLPLLRQIH
ncbi:MAG: hypothetical protein F6K14_18765 [Symploca sp. SIO2C1]|nr:hypothetical protein [Symploca sp. SIO2C1]